MLHWAAKKQADFSPKARYCLGSFHCGRSASSVGLILHVTDRKYTTLHIILVSLWIRWPCTQRYQRFQRNKPHSLTVSISYERKEGREEGSKDAGLRSGRRKGDTKYIYKRKGLEGSSDEEEACRTRNDVQGYVDPSLTWKCLAAFTKGLLRLIKCN